MKIFTDFYVNPPHSWFLTDIWFYAPPKKVVYKSGECFDTEGLVVQAVYNNNLIQKVSNYTYSPMTPLVDGDKKVTISFTDGGITKTRDITIVVLPVLIGIEVTTMPEKTVYTYGETPDYTGMVVTATYSDATTKIVTDYSVSTAPLSTLGSVGLTVSYTEDGITSTDEVPITVDMATISALPTQANSLTYNGTAQSPIWNNYDTNQLTLAGTTSAANAGDYEVVFTPKYGYCWPDNTTTAKNITWIIGKALIGSLPTQNGSLTYNGSAQIPTWNNYDTTQFTLDGDTSGTNAGSYNVIFTPTSNYEWEDGTTTGKTVVWSIDKAPTIITVTPNPINVTAENNPITVAVTTSRGTHFGGLRTLSSDSSIIDLIDSEDSDDGLTLYFTFNCSQSGEAILYLDMLEDDNFLAAEEIEVPVTVSLFVSRLPEGYTEVEYIYNDATVICTLWDNMEIYPSRYKHSNAISTFDIELMTPETSGDLYGYNGRTSNTSISQDRQLLSWSASSRYIYYYYGTYNKAYLRVKIPDDTNRLKIVIDNVNDTLIVNDTVTTGSVTPSSPSMGMVLFGYTSGFPSTGATYINFVKCNTVYRLYSYSCIYMKSDTITSNVTYIPCICNSTNEVGLIRYNEITQEYETFIGRDNNLIAGPKVTTPPL